MTHSFSPRGWPQLLTHRKVPQSLTVTNTSPKRYVYHEYHTRYFKYKIWQKRYIFTYEYDYFGQSMNDNSSIPETPSVLTSRSSRRCMMGRAAAQMHDGKKCCASCIWCMWTCSTRSSSPEKTPVLKKQQLSSGVGVGHKESKYKNHFSNFRVFFLVPKATIILLLKIQWQSIDNFNIKHYRFSIYYCSLHKHFSLNTRYNNI